MTCQAILDDWPVCSMIYRIVAQYVRPELCRSVERDCDLEGDLKLDGLDRQSIALQLDEHFGIEIRDEQLEGWQTVGDIVATVTEACGAELA